MITLRATSFATRQDLAAFSAAVTAGKTVQQAIDDDDGDNGVGAWNDPTWPPEAKPPIVAMPAPIPRGTIVDVTMNGGTVQCVVKDRSPQGVVDLSPSALRAFGLASDTDLNTTAEVQVVS